MLRLKYAMRERGEVSNRLRSNGVLNGRCKPNSERGIEGRNSTECDG